MKTARCCYHSPADLLKELRELSRALCSNVLHITLEHKEVLRLDQEPQGCKPLIVLLP